MPLIGIPLRIFCCTTGCSQLKLNCFELLTKHSAVCHSSCSFIVIYDVRYREASTFHTSNMTEKEDLETYQVQLSQVELSIAADPTNAELASLRDELKELIELTLAAIAQAEAASSSKAESSRKAATAQVYSHTWSAGDECLAKYSGDGAWYPARITSVGGASENRVYSIVFKGYNTTELTSAAGMKPLPASYAASGGGGGPPGSNKRKLDKAEEEEKERKKKKNEKKVEVRAAKAKEQNDKQATWQKFTKKADKKGVHIAGVAGTSIFKTPDNPLGKGAASFLFLLTLYCYWLT